MPLKVFFIMIVVLVAVSAAIGLFAARRRDSYWIKRSGCANPAKSCERQA